MAYRIIRHFEPVVHHYGFNDYSVSYPRLALPNTYETEGCALAVAERLNVAGEDAEERYTVETTAGKPVYPAWIGPT